MKYILSLLLVFLFSTFSFSQGIKNDTLNIDAALVGSDTIVKLPIELEEVYISNNKSKFKSAEARKQYLILQRRVLKVYPFAKAAADRLTALKIGMDALKSDRDKKRYFKIVENYLTLEFEGQLKKLSRKDGQILVKLIDRQTGSSTFELIKDLKSGWKAFWSNNTARLFDINLKTKFDPLQVSEDMTIEGILYKSFTDGNLSRQPAKNGLSYISLLKSWNEKLKNDKENN